MSERMEMVWVVWTRLGGDWAQTAGCRAVPHRQLYTRAVHYNTPVESSRPTLTVSSYYHRPLWSVVLLNSKELRQKRRNGNKLVWKKQTSELPGTGPICSNNRIIKSSIQSSSNANTVIAVFPTFVYVIVLKIMIFSIYHLCFKCSPLLLSIAVNQIST